MSRKRTEIISLRLEDVERLLHEVTRPRDKESLIAARMAMTRVVGRARSCIQLWLKAFQGGGVPYCPELDPVENIRDQLKEAVRNRVFERVEVLREVLLPRLREFLGKSPGAELPAWQELTGSKRKRFLHSYFTCFQKEKVSVRQRWLLGLKTGDFRD